MFLILGAERWFCETETSSRVITFLHIYKRVVSDEKYCILFVNQEHVTLSFSHRIVPKLNLVLLEVNKK